MQYHGTPPEPQGTVANSGTSLHIKLAVLDHQHWCRFNGLDARNLYLIIIISSQQPSNGLDILCLHLLDDLHKCWSVCVTYGRESNGIKDELSTFLDDRVTRIMSGGTVAGAMEEILDVAHIRSDQNRETNYGCSEILPPQQYDMGVKRVRHKTPKL